MPLKITYQFSDILIVAFGNKTLDLQKPRTFSQPRASWITGRPVLNIYGNVFADLLKIFVTLYWAAHRWSIFWTNAKAPLLFPNLVLPSFARTVWYGTRFCLKWVLIRSISRQPLPLSKHGVGCGAQFQVWRREVNQLLHEDFLFKRPDFMWSFWPST